MALDYLPKGQKGPMPADALQSGVHTALSASSKHKKLVSSVLHLKKESVGRKGYPTAYNVKAKAFGQQKAKRS